MKAAFSASNIKHLHISDVQVGPGFIQRREPQFAGIQDELQLFNGYPVLLPVAPGHIFPGRELLQQTPTQFLQPVPNASSVSQHEQLTERHQQVVVWMQPSSKISSVFSMCSLHVELFNIVLLLILVHSCTLSNHWGQVRESICLPFIMYTQREPVLNTIEEIYQVYLTVVWFYSFNPWSLWSSVISCFKKPLLGKIQRFCCTQCTEDRRLWCW